MKPEDIVVSRKGARFQGRHIPCSIGRNGVTKRKREGDGATPVGTHRLVGLLYRPDRIAQPTAWARPIGLNDLWSDDPKDIEYNHLVRSPHSFSHEHLRRSDPLYDLVLITDWNWPYSVRGRGSAIFIHRWRGPGYPTEGCVAFSAPDLLWICRNLKFRSRLIVQP